MEIERPIIRVVATTAEHSLLSIEVATGIDVFLLNRQLIVAIRYFTA